MPLSVGAAAFAVLIIAGVLLHLTLTTYREHIAWNGFTDDPTPVALAIAGERLSIPAAMLRYPATRRGGPVERADLVLHWPTLEGYSDGLASGFTDLTAAPIVFATIAPRDNTLDSTERLDEVYGRFFTGKALPGPAGLVGRVLTADSGYGSEIVYFSPSQPRPFVARCLAKETPEMPSTCLRDVKFGRGLSLLYRFNRNLLGDWKALDAGLRQRADSFIVR